MDDDEFEKLLSIRKHQILYDGEYLSDEEKNDRGLSAAQLSSMTVGQMTELNSACVRWRLDRLTDRVISLEKRQKRWFCQ